MINIISYNNKYIITNTINICNDFFNNNVKDILCVKYDIYSSINIWYITTRFFYNS